MIKTKQSLKINIIFYILIFALFIIYSNFGLSAMSGNSGDNDQENLYKEAKQLILRAKKLEKKNKPEKALKLYQKANKKLEKAYKKDKKNADVLNYLGFTLRKMGDFKNAEIYYLKGLKIKPKHLGINEYLGELYVQTNRIDLAKQRLEVIKNCNCEEYEELKELIEKK